MMARKTNWSFAAAVLEAKRAIESNRSLPSQVERLQTAIASESSTPQQIASVLGTSVAVSYWCQALIEASKDARGAWPLVHLVWRMNAFYSIVYFKRYAQLRHDQRVDYRSGKIRLNALDRQSIAGHLMNGAFSFVLGEDHAGSQHFDEIVRLLDTNDSLVEPSVFQEGGTHTFLLWLYFKWKGLQSPTYLSRQHTAFEAIISSWNDEDRFQIGVLDLVKLHAQKSANWTKEDSEFVFGLQTGPYRELPVEIIFLLRVRRDLGLHVPDIDHPIMKSPISVPPFGASSPFEKNLWDAYERCRQLIPGLVIPWEDRINPTH
jgi:hypothetical protein